MYHIDAAYINDYRLLNARKEEIVSENAPLNSIQYALLRNYKYNKLPVFIMTAIGNYIDKCRTGTEGLYNQFPFIAKHERDRYMSPDQLIAFVAFFYLTDQLYRIKEIHNYLTGHFFTYDNTRPGEINIDRIMQASAIFFTGAATGKKIYYPLLAATALFSCATKRGESSGKLKAWVMLKTLKMERTLWFAEKLLAGFKRWREVFDENHKEENDPVRLMAHNVYPE